MTARIGRFEIRGELGRGAQSVVWRGFDPQLQREVAIKTLHFSRRDAKQSAALLAEARMVGRLRHPNIVPIYEAGEHDGDVYLVFECVPGKNLAEFLKQSGALPAVRAVTLLRPVLDAIGHAHAQGIIHRDLKPSNILLDENGNPRVMDFGIATPTTGAEDDPNIYTGSPAYMAPEYVLRHEIGERSDLYAAGLVLFEMLTGQRAVQGSDLYAILHRIANDDIRLPESVSVDSRLSAILFKSIARDPGLRYQTAAQFAEALDNYLDPADEPVPAASGRQATIDFLLRRMRHKSDFPALSESVTAINRIASSDNESVDKLSNSILKDFALTNKLLRLVNSAYYRPAGGGSISTVSRAIVVLGFEVVRNIAITVLLFEHLQNKANANQLKEDFLRANLAGILAKDIAAAATMRDLEQAFICDLFHSLGRLLAQFYFPEEADEIRKVMAQKNCTEDLAARQVLGLSHEDLGMAIARQWGFPALIVGAMQRVPPGLVHKPATTDERLRTLSGYANEICDLIATATPETRERELRKAMQRYGQVVTLEAETLQQVVARAVEEVSEFARVIHLNTQQTAFGKQMQSFARASGVTSAVNPENDTDFAGGTVLGEEQPPTDEAGNVAPSAQPAHHP